MVVSDRSNYVPNSMFNCSKPKTGGLSSITKRCTRSSPFDVRIYDVRVCILNNLVNSVKAFYVWCSMSVRSKPKFRCSSSIMNRWKCFKFEKWCTSPFDFWWNGVWLITIKKWETKTQITFQTINYQNIESCNWVNDLNPIKFNLVLSHHLARFPVLQRQSVYNVVIF